MAGKGGVKPVISGNILKNLSFSVNAEEYFVDKS